MDDREKHNAAVARLIELANQMKNEGLPIELVSAALMSASGVYATYTAAGNDGALNPSGVDKVVEVYRRNLEHVQEAKKAEIEARKKQG